MCVAVRVERVHGACCSALGVGVEGVGTRCARAVHDCRDPRARLRSRQGSLFEKTSIAGNVNAGDDLSRRAQKVHVRLRTLFQVCHHQPAAVAPRKDVLGQG